MLNQKRLTRIEEVLNKKQPTFELFLDNVDSYQLLPQYLVI